MIHIIIDTNFFMISHKNRIDIPAEISELVSEEHRLITFTGVLDELTGIAEGSKGVDGTAARVALELIKGWGIEVVESLGYVDDFIVRYVGANRGKRFIVCTADAELKNRVRELGVGFICMRSQKKLRFC